jgi:murein DD-endopeptidase MepM/ murein hydrolase activator NlpD
MLRIVAGILLILAALVATGLRARSAPVHGLPEGLQDDSTVSTSFDALSDSLARVLDQLMSIPSILPTSGRVSSDFSGERYHPLLHVTRPHDGIDIAASMGAPVIAPAAGVVRTIAVSPSYGLSVEVDHAGAITTRYGHLSRVHVQAHQTVVRGQLLGEVGNSGLSTGPHLHYEIRIAGRAVDPLRF